MSSSGGSSERVVNLIAYTAVVLRILRCDWLLVNQRAGSNPDKGSGGTTTVLVSGQALTINVTVGTKHAFQTFHTPNVPIKSTSLFYRYSQATIPY